MKTKETEEVKIPKGKKSKVSTDFTVLVPDMPVSGMLYVFALKYME